MTRVSKKQAFLRRKMDKVIDISMVSDRKIVITVLAQGSFVSLMSVHVP